jgi:hypothetical protein
VRPLCTLVNLAWTGASLRRSRRYRSALADSESIQRRLLRRYLRLNAGTVFGRHFGFDRIRDVRGYQSRVPLSTYEDYIPLIRRITAGEQRVLTVEPVRRLVPSSGSVGARKLVPYTAGLQSELNRAIGPWVVDLYRRRPALACGPAYWSISPAIDLTQNEPSAVPIGFEDDSDYLGGVFSPLVRVTLAVPPSVPAAGSLRRARQGHRRGHRERTGPIGPGITRPASPARRS